MFLFGRPVQKQSFIRPAARELIPVDVMHRFLDQRGSAATAAQSGAVEMAPH